MPIYEYRCECGAEFEKLVDSRTVVACPTCDSPRVTRRLSMFRAMAGTRAGDAPASGGMGGGCCGGGCGCH